MRTAALITMLAIGLSAGTAAAESRTISIGTAATAGVFYPLGGAMAKIISDTIPELKATAEVTGGSIDNLKLVGRDPSYIGLVTADVAADAVAGRGRFTSPLPVRTLIALNPGHLHVVATEASGIRQLADLKGKRVATNQVGSSIEVVALRSLQVLGLDPDKDIIRERLSINDAVSAMKDGKIDAFFLIGGIPNPAVLDVITTPGLKVRLVDTGDLVAGLSSRFGAIYVAGSIPGGTYPGIDKTISAVDVWNLLIANEALPEKDAHDIVKALFAQKSALVAVNKDLNYLELGSQVEPNSPIPFHAGALAFQKESKPKP